MDIFKNIGESRKVLQDTRGSWQVATKYEDNDAIPEYGLVLPLKDWFLQMRRLSVLNSKNYLKNQLTIHS